MSWQKGFITSGNFDMLHVNLAKWRIWWNLPKCYQKFQHDVAKGPHYSGQFWRYMYGEFGKMANLAGICESVCANSRKWQRPPWQVMILPKMANLVKKWWIWQKIRQSLANIQMSRQREDDAIALPIFALLTIGGRFFGPFLPRGLFCHLIWIFTKPVTNFHQIRHFFYQIHHFHQLHHFIVIVHWISKQCCLYFAVIHMATWCCSELKGLGRTWIPSGAPNDSFLLNTLQTLFRLFTFWISKMPSKQHTKMLYLFGLARGTWVFSKLQELQHYFAENFTNAI